MTNPILICSIEGCGKRHEARGWCPMHYQRWRKYGDPLAPQIKPNTPYGEPLNWLITALATRDRTDCWHWPYGGMNGGRGYGSLTFNGRIRPAHQVSYELDKGSIPDGLEIDHVCHNQDSDCFEGDHCPHRSCVNPDHLEAVVHIVNASRGRTGSYYRGDFCKHGHSLIDPTNIYLWQGRRFCKICRKRHDRLQAAKRKEQRRQKRLSL